MREVLQRTSGKVRSLPATLHGPLKGALEPDDARRHCYRLTIFASRVLNAECDRLQLLVHTIRVKQARVTE